MTKNIKKITLTGFVSEKGKIIKPTVPFKKYSSNSKNRDDLDCLKPHQRNHMK